MLDNTEAGRFENNVVVSFLTNCVGRTEKVAVVLKIVDSVAWIGTAVVRVFEPECHVHTCQLCPRTRAGRERSAVAFIFTKGDC